MSYLNAVRLHFAGQFQANVSTVNNDPVHFRNSTFQPSFQWQEGQGSQMNPPNGWFNPEGDGGFRLLGCKITSAWTQSGPVGPDDPVLSSQIADSDDRVCGKLVDLDPQQQLVSEIWGMQIRLSDRTGSDLLTGDFLEAPFIDLWDRAVGASGNGDVDGGAAYQSVLQNLVWGDVSSSPFLTQLKALVESEIAAGGEGSLSIKFNLDGINLDFRSPSFMCGRIVGTIGPTAPGEPRHMVLGRHFVASQSRALVPPQSFFYPTGSLNFCAGVIDQAAGSLYLDLGNALPTTIPDGPMFDLGNLTVHAMTTNQGAVSLGSIPSQGAHGYASQMNWYEGCAGVVVLPLNAAQLAAAATSQLTISGTIPNGFVTFVSETSGGGYVRADKYVYRVTPGESVDVTFYAMQWGQPLADFDIQFVQDPSQLQPGAPLLSEQPSPAYLNVATPADAIKFASTATTDQNGKAVLTINTSNPETPRWAGPTDFGLDGQVYGVRASFKYSSDPNANNPVAPSDPVDPWDFVSILLWSEFKTSDPVQWSEIQPILQQYANLYPVMNRFLNLGDLDSVKKNLRLLKLAFGLAPSDPNSMPVTRDLSKQKRQALLSWLANPVGAPTLPLPPPAPSAAVAPSTAAVPSTQRAFAALGKGGKTAAAARRLIRQGAKK
jgi:hypothetical protein